MITAPWGSRTSLRVRRIERSSSPADLIDSCTPVATSSWALRNSGIARLPNASLAAFHNSGPGSLTRLRLTRSTRRYSSSIPTVNAGREMRCIFLV